MHTHEPCTRPPSRDDGRYSRLRREVEPRCQPLTAGPGLIHRGPRPHTSRPFGAFNCSRGSRVHVRVVTLSSCISTPCSWWQSPARHLPITALSNTNSTQKPWQLGCPSDVHSTYPFRCLLNTHTKPSPAGHPLLFYPTDLTVLRHGELDPFPSTFHRKASP
jgi:hypothetical protein